MHHRPGNRRRGQPGHDAVMSIQTSQTGQHSSHRARKREVPRLRKQKSAAEGKSRFCGAMLNWLPPVATKTELSFEKAMERLEAIVEEMESGKMPLEELLVRYEEGMKLVKVCQERLTRAEQKIEIITRDHAGKVTVQNFDATESPSAPVATAAIETKENDEVSLF